MTPPRDIDREKLGVGQLGASVVGLMAVQPVPVKHALPWNVVYHRRLKECQGAMWAAALLDGARVVGVILVGRPNARRLQDGWTFQVLRCAVEPGHDNGCSMLYAAASRGVRGWGARNLLTYTDEDQHGSSLHASGWIREEANWEPILFGGGQADRPSRPRKERENSMRRHRWWAPWSVYLLTRSARS
jgi:hypothetical protein